MKANVNESKSADKVLDLNTYVQFNDKMVQCYKKGGRTSTQYIDPERTCKAIMYISSN